MPQFGKRTPLTRQHFAEFETAFGKDPLGGTAALKKRKDTGETGSFRNKVKLHYLLGKPSLESNARPYHKAKQI